MACVIANVQLFVCRPYAESFLSTMQQGIMGAFTARLSLLAGLRTLPEHVLRLQARKTQPILRGELSSLSWVLFLKYNSRVGVYPYTGGTEHKMVLLLLMQRKTLL